MRSPQSGNKIFPGFSQQFEEDDHTISERSKNYRSHDPQIQVERQMQLVSKNVCWFE